ncbi:MAG: FAD:protein FMN transferase [Eubacteriales bacterium]|nr:FAD:protein FMN transferase [Eubacteriales bacterium]
MKRFFSLLLAALMLLSLCACGAEKSAGKVVYAMDTVMTLTAYGKDADTALGEAEFELYRLEQLLDRFTEDGEVNAINANAGKPTGVSDELAALVALAQHISDKTSGAFDPTIAPVMDAWGFGGSEFRVPTQPELEVLLPNVDADQILISYEDRPRITIGTMQALDLGGIAKGYAGDCVKSIFEKHGCTGVIDLGGDVTLVGRKSDGSDWRVAIKDPYDPSAFLGTLSASDCTVVTSGVYERNFTENGVTYHHIIDPATGCPAESGLVSVTVVCADGAYADALSTAAFVLGIDRAAALRDAFATETPLLELIFVTGDGHVLYSDGLDGILEPNTESGYTYEHLS